MSGDQSAEARLWRTEIATTCMADLFTGGGVFHLPIDTANAIRDLHNHALAATSAEPSANFRQPDETRWPGYGRDFKAKPSADDEEIARNLVKRLNEISESGGDSEDWFCAILEVLQAAPEEAQQ